MKKLIHHSLKDYSALLSQKIPAPGGGSASAYTAVLGVALIQMVTLYSKGKRSTPSLDRRFDKIYGRAEQYRSRLLELVDLDAKAYLEVVRAKEKPKAEQKKAAKDARDIPAEIARLCYKAIQLTPLLVQKGNRYLLSDIEVAVEMLLAAYKGALINVEVNQ